MIVYYTTTLSQFVYDPEPLMRSSFSHLPNVESIVNTKKCPALADYFYNAFVIKNFIDYDFFWDGQNFSMSNFDQVFFENWCHVRDNQVGFVSYRHPGLMFYSEESVEMTLTPPFLHDVDMNKNAMMIPGVYNIGKHLRTLEAAFLFKEKNTSVRLNREDPLFYLFFNCKEKIKFKKFFCHPEIIQLSNSILFLKNKNYIQPLSFWYDIHERNYKKKILKLIKSNLMD